jgi:capsular polysaccharide transport system permease protein
MTIKPRVRKFRIRRGGSLGSADPTSETSMQDNPPETPEVPESESRAIAPRGDPLPQNAMDAIRQEGLTGRQLRMARRIAQKHGHSAQLRFPPYFLILLTLRRRQRYGIEVWKMLFGS